MRALLFVVALLLAAAGEAAAAERITSFVSEVAIGADSALTVKETIAVVSEGNEIKRGIQRDFPTRYKDRNGLSFVVGFEVLGVKRDGRDEPYTVMSISNGERIRIGSADVFLDNGPHVYEITYKTTRQLGYFEGFDELYWNVTGNSWTFPIERAEAIIQLPPGATIKQHAEYTGRQGESGHDAEVTQSTGDRYQAHTTRTLAPNEGFTVAVGWPKGFVSPPTEIDKATDAVKDNLGLFAILAGVLLSFLYYLFAWFRVGRDPPEGTIIPLFTPPTGLGPGGMRYVWKQKFDEKGFAASLVGLAVKGRARIVENGKNFSIERKEDESQPLTRAEAALYRAMPAGMTLLQQANHAKVSAMKSALEDRLEKEYEGVAFVRNLKWFWGGVAISVLALALGALLLPTEDAAIGLFLSIWNGVWWGVLLVLSWSLVKGLIAARGVLAKIRSVFSLGFLLPFFVVGGFAPVAIFFSATSPGLYAFAGGAILLVIMGFVFHRLLRAPTVSGRQLLDQIEGFRMYMTTAEEERLKVLHPPEKTPELFERYLPYALALDCENEWNTKFAAVLAAAAAAGVAAAPVWYTGNSWNTGNMGGFTTSLGSSLATTTSAASVPPGTSSGSGGFSSGGGFSGGGGGGSSGGGGGGGGGSGW
ncbi:DUF2207 domain-containing protein [Taklimakanibacter deserti]|uniref:DUF2207 domain-containing protein n=1 Tax=Taklimakanibacter deserti TaxID=2267839 RepID=UPI0034D4AD2E